jgi:hypothetical protein
VYGHILGMGLFFEKYSINVDSYICMSAQPYEHMYTYTTSMSTSKRLSQVDLKIHKVGHQECLPVDGDVGSH